MGRDVLDVSAGVGMSFSVPFYYTGMAFAGEPTYVDCADKLDSFSGPCRNLKICLEEGTTHEETLANIFPGPETVLGLTPEAAVDNLENGRCNVLVNDSIAIPESLLRLLGYTGPYKLGSKLFSKEPLSIGTSTWAKAPCNVITGLNA